MSSGWQYSSSWKYTLKVLDVHQLQRQKDWTWDLEKPIEKSYPWSIKLISKHFRNIFNPKAYQSLFQSNLSSALTTLCECWKSRHSSICISILQPSSHHCLGQELQMLMLLERDEKEEEKLPLEQKREEKLPWPNRVADNNDTWKSMTNSCCAQAHVTRGRFAYIHFSFIVT